MKMTPGTPKLIFVSIPFCSVSRPPNLDWFGVQGCSAALRTAFVPLDRSAAVFGMKSSKGPGSYNFLCGIHQNTEPKWAGSPTKAF